jgi:hypothetical protein
LESREGTSDAWKLPAGAEILTLRLDERLSDRVQQTVYVKVTLERIQLILFFASQVPRELPLPICIFPQSM